MISETRARGGSGLPSMVPLKAASSPGRAIALECDEVEHHAGAAREPAHDAGAVVDRVVEGVGVPVHRIDGEAVAAFADGSVPVLGSVGVCSATIGKSGDSFTIDPVHWYTDPFHNPIYYGARIVRWFSGRAGAMLDFIHSKAIAGPGEEAAFTGTIDGKPLPPRARIHDTCRSSSSRTATTC